MHFKKCIQDFFTNNAGARRITTKASTCYTKQLLKQVWSNKEMAPTIQTFASRLLRRALPTGMRAGKCSTHVKKHCSRCNVEEDDMHLFFLCPFAKAALFTKLWYIRSEYLIQQFGSVPTIIQSLLTSNQPQASINNIITFLWCIWKSRNDKLFGRKENSPLQVNHATQAIMLSQNLASSNERDFFCSQPA